MYMHSMRGRLKGGCLPPGTECHGGAHRSGGFIAFAAILTRTSFAVERISFTLYNNDGETVDLYVTAFPLLLCVERGWQDERIRSIIINDRIRHFDCHNHV